MGNPPQSDKFILYQEVVGFANRREVTNSMAITTYVLAFGGHFSPF
jgi:hypothetical protein